MSIDTGLIGKTVEQVYLGGDKTLLKFVFTDGTQVNWHAEGDCCSSSWFESVEALDFKGTILSVDNPQVEEDGPASAVANSRKGEHDVLAVYFMTVKTDKGRLFVEMRNDSNGYYSGHISVHGELNPKYFREKNWKPID